MATSSLGDLPAWLDGLGPRDFLWDGGRRCAPEGNVERHTLDRLESFVAGTAGKRLTYKAYIQ